MLYRLDADDSSDESTLAFVEDTEQSGVDTPVNSSLHGSIDWVEGLSEETTSDEMTASFEGPFEVDEEPKAVSEDSPDSREEIFGLADHSVLKNDPLNDGDSEKETEDGHLDQSVPTPGELAKQWLQNNPGKAACIGAGTVMMLGPGLIATPVLGAFGFGGSGIVGGSIAAALQGSLGNVAAGGIFATLQSAGAGGYGVATVYGAVQAGGVGLAAAGAASTRNRK